MTARRPVHLNYTKWDGSPHWQIDAVLLGEDEWGSWLYAPAGSTMSRPGMSVVSKLPEVILVSPDLASTPGFYATWQNPDSGWAFDLYADMTTIPVWTGEHEVTMVDLDLDVVRHAGDGRVEVLDEDEFAEHRVRYGYPDDICTLATATCEQVAAAVRAGAEPYGTVGRAWLETGIRG